MWQIIQSSWNKFKEFIIYSFYCLFLAVLGLALLLLVCKQLTQLFLIVTYGWFLICLYIMHMCLYIFVCMWESIVQSYACDGPKKTSVSGLAFYLVGGMVVWCSLLAMQGLLAHQCRDFLPSTSILPIGALRWQRHAILTSSMWTGDPNSAPHPWKASALSTEISSQHLTRNF